MLSPRVITLIFACVASPSLLPYLAPLALPSSPRSTPQLVLANSASTRPYQAALSAGTNYSFSSFGPQLANKLHLSSTATNTVALFGNAGSVMPSLCLLRPGRCRARRPIAPSNHKSATRVLEADDVLVFGRRVYLTGPFLVRTISKAGTNQSIKLTHLGGCA